MFYNNDPEHEDYGLVHWGKWFRLYFTPYDWKIGVEYKPREEGWGYGWDIAPAVFVQVGPFLFMREGETREVRPPDA
jgi:hypothetical protein